MLYNVFSMLHNVLKGEKVQISVAAIRGAALYGYLA